MALVTRLAMGMFGPSESIPSISLKVLLDFGGKTHDGRLVEGVAVPWFEIARRIQSDPDGIYQIDPWKWEEIIAGAYKRAGYDEVILTPRSGDKGRDIIATRFGVGSIRIFGQVKAYRPGHLVTAEEVRAMVGVITGAANVSKGIITTTSEFAPRVREDDYIKPLLPYRLELQARDTLIAWLNGLAQSNDVWRDVQR
jgi:restriction system protein